MAHPSIPPTQECRNVLSLLPAYSEEALSADQSALVRAHLQACPYCAARAQSLVQLPKLLHDALPAPAPTLHRQIMQAVHSTAQSAPRPKTKKRSHLSIAAALLCFVLIAAALLRGGFWQVPQAPDTLPSDAPSMGEEPPAPNTPLPPEEPSDMDETSSSDDPPAEEVLPPEEPSDMDETSSSDDPPAEDVLPPDHAALVPTPGTEDESSRPHRFPLHTALYFAPRSDGYYVCEAHQLALRMEGEQLVLLSLINGAAASGTREGTNLWLYADQSYCGTISSASDGTLILHVYP